MLNENGPLANDYSVSRATGLINHFVYSVVVTIFFATCMGSSFSSHEVLHKSHPRINSSRIVIVSLGDNMVGGIRGA